MMSIVQLPLVTIVTPTFNQGQFIEETIRSVLAQTYPNIEYIVLDAMSNDQTPEILDRYRDRISLVRREPDRGQSDAIVKGFKLARGELVGWINSDDLLYPDCVAHIVEAYRQQPEAAIFYCSRIDIISETSERLNTMHVPLRGRDHLLRECNTLIQPGSFYRRTALEAVDYFDTNLRYSMDLDLWLRLLTVGGFVDVSETPIAAYREWGGTKTSTGGVRLATERKELLQRHGGSKSDPVQKQMHRAIAKGKVKEATIRLRRVLASFMRVPLLIFYYGFLIHLPASSSRYTRWAKLLRSSVCKPLFKSSGVSINIEKGAHFGSGRNVEIGNRSGLGVNCQILGSVRLGNDVMMGPDVMFISTTHRFDSVAAPMIDQGFSEDRPISIDDDVWIGARCTFLPGVQIGSGSIVGAGSVVTKSVPKYSIVAGNPARVIRSRC